MISCGSILKIAVIAVKTKAEKTVFRARKLKRSVSSSHGGNIHINKCSALQIGDIESHSTGDHSLESHSSGQGSLVR